MVRLNSKVNILWIVVLLLMPLLAKAGGNLIQLDPADVTHVIEKKWDDRMLPIHWSLSSDGNPGSGMTNADIINEFSAAFDTWQSIPTNRLMFTFSGEVDRRSSGLGGPLASGVDGINLVTFTDPEVIFPPGVVGLALTFSFTSDTTIDATNNDLDGDGSPDIPNGIYSKGTIFDGDIIFNSALNYSISGLNNTLDIRAIALHEIGHFVGLSHSSIDGAVMYPFLSNDIVSARAPKNDDINYTSLFYPQEPAFSSTYGTISGHITNGFDGFRVLGAHVFAVDVTTGEKLVGAYSGIDGSYHIPIQSGTYYVGIEPLDADPPALDPTRINEVIALTQDTFFTEELYDANESNVEADPLAASPITVAVNADTDNIDLVTNTVDVPGISRVLQPGINYLAYPVSVPTELMASDLLMAMGEPTEINAIDRFNTTTGLFERTSYLNNNPAGVDFPIQRGEGYLVYAKTQKIVTFAGVPDCPDIEVKTGLNLIGVPCPPATYSGFDLLQSLGNEFEVVNVKRYDNSISDFESVKYEGGVPIGTDFRIANGEAYIAEMAVPKSRVKVPSQGQIYPPAITGISPGRGIPGDNVLIIGQGFDIDPVDNLVVFNGVGSQVLFATPTVLTAKVPLTAASGPVTVSVDGKESNSVDFIVEDTIVVENANGDTELISGQTAQGELTVEYEQDRYTFIALQGSVVTIGAEAVVTGSPDLMLVLEGPSGVILASDDDSGVGTDPLIDKYMLSETGVYTAVVTSVSGSGAGQYTLSLDIKSSTTTPRISKLNGGVQTGLAGTQLSSPFEVLVTSSSGRPLAGVPVTFTATNLELGQQSVKEGLLINAGTATVTTSGNGLATVTATLPSTPGVFDIVVTVVGVPTATPVTLRVGSTSTLVTDILVSGNNQTCGGSGCEVNTALAEPYKVTYLDANGNPVANVLSSWGVVSGGGSISPSGEQTTGATGVAQVTHTLGQQLYFSDTTIRIPQTVATTVPGQVKPILFGSMAKAGSATKIVQNRTDFSRITYNTAALNAVYITVTDAFDNPVENSAITFNSSDLTIAPGLYKGKYFPNNLTNEEGIWVGMVSAGGVTPTIDEFGSTGSQGLASTYNFSVSTGSVSASYNVDVDMGPTMVTAYGQGGSALITKDLGKIAKLVMRYQRIDSYPGSGDDDDGGDWTNDNDFSAANLRGVAIDGVVVKLTVHRDDDKDEADVGETPTKLNANEEVTLTTDGNGLAEVDVTMGGIGGGINVIGEIDSPITVEFKHDNDHPGQDGALINSQQFPDEDNYRESTSLNAIPVELTITIDDKNGLPADKVSGLVLETLAITLNGSNLYDADGSKPDYNKYPNFSRILLDGTEQSAWPSGDMLKSGGISEVKVIYRPKGTTELQSGANTVNVLSGLKDKVGNEVTANSPHEFNF